MSSIDYEDYRVNWENLYSQYFPPLILGIDSTEPQSIARTLENPPKFLIIIVQAGKAALARGKGCEITQTKTIRKYMTRQTQGKSQLNFLDRKGKSRLGSRIRLQQSQNFFMEISECIELWTQENLPEKVFVHCTPKLKGHWNRSPFPCPIDLRGENILKIPLAIKPPCTQEVIRIHKLLCQPQKRQPRPQENWQLNEWCNWQNLFLSRDVANQLKKAMQVGALHGFPELLAIVGVPQDPKWHPEGDVWIHTVLVVEAAQKIVTREALKPEAAIILILAALCHDLGKPYTTTQTDGRIRALGHAEKGVEIARVFMKRLGCPPSIAEQVIPLVKEHLAHASMREPTKRAVTRLKKRLAPSDLSMLLLLIEADYSGRPPLPQGLPESAQALVKFREEST